MGRFDANLPDDFIRELEQLGSDVDRVAPLMLEAGAIPLRTAIKRRARPHTRTGELEGSPTIRKPQKKDGIWSIRITFSNSKKHKGVNTKKALALEYGTRRQRAQPFLRPAVDDANEDVLKEMQDVFEWELLLKNVPHTID